MVERLGGGGDFLVSFFMLNRSADLVFKILLIIIIVRISSSSGFRWVSHERVI